MGEWTIFGVVVAIVSAFILVYTPLRNASKEREERAIQQEKERLESTKAFAAASEANTRAITELTTSLRIFTEHFKEVEENNHLSHQAIYQRLDEKGKILARHDEKLNDHERRISEIERRN